MNDNFEFEKVSNAKIISGECEQNNMRIYLFSYIDFQLASDVFNIEKLKYNVQANSIMLFLNIIAASELLHAC